MTSYGIDSSSTLYWLRTLIAQLWW